MLTRRAHNERPNKKAFTQQWPRRNIKYAQPIIANAICTLISISFRSNYSILRWARALSLILTLSLSLTQFGRMCVVSLARPAEMDKNAFSTVPGSCRRARLIGPQPGLLLNNIEYTRHARYGAPSKEVHLACTPNRIEFGTQHMLSLSPILSMYLSALALIRLSGRCAANPYNSFISSKR